jgi:hypothetical protein
VFELVQAAMLPLYASIHAASQQALYGDPLCPHEMLFSKRRSDAEGKSRLTLSSSWLGLRVKMQTWVS